MKRTLASSLLAAILLLGLVQHHSNATAGVFDWSALTADEAVAEEMVAEESAEESIDTASTDDVTTNSSATPKKKKGNGFVRALGAPFRALGRLFGGGKKSDQQARRLTNKETEKFAGTKLVRIKDATTPETTDASIAHSNTAATPASPTAFDNHLNKGRELLIAGDVNGAINELTAATAINPKSAEANKLLGVAYESKGLRDSALKAFEVAVHSEENNAEHLNNLGYLLFKNGDYERATKYLKRAARIAKNNSRIWNNLGLVYCERGKFDDAYKSFAHAAGEYGGRLNVAAQLQQRGYAKDAIKHLEKAQALRPNSPDVLAKLVALYEMTGRPTDAENARRAIVALKTFADAK